LGRKILFVTTDQQRYDSLGCNGELYDLRNDPQQWENLWDDPARRSLRSDLVADLYDHLPQPRRPPLPVEAPA